MDCNKKQYFYGYIITNSITGKEYVGITSKTVEERWRKHLSSMKKNQKYYLYRSMHKYGVDSFTVKEVIRTNSWETICKWEIKTINHRNTFAPNGYNMTLGGEGSCGYKWSNKQKQNHSVRIKKSYENNPELSKNKSKKMRQAYIDNPGLKKTNSERMKKVYKNKPGLRKTLGEKTKQMHENNPEIAKQQSIMMKKRYADNSILKKRLSEKIKKAHQKNPNLSMIKSNRSKNNLYRAIPVLFFYKFFRSTLEASLYFETPRTTVRRIIKKQKPGCQKLIKGQEYNWEIPSC